MLEDMALTPLRGRKPNSNRSIATPVYQWALGIVIVSSTLLFNLWYSKSTHNVRHVNVEDGTLHRDGLSLALMKAKGEGSIRSVGLVWG